MRRSTRQTAVTGVACLALSAAFAAGADGASAASRSTIPGSQPAWANSKALKSAAPAGDVVHARVYLPWRNQSALDALARSVSTPGNASYGKYLTPQQFSQQFAPAQSDIVAVQQWLRGAGFSVVDIPGNAHYVAVEGTVAQANAAFSTTLGEYSTHGLTLRAPEAAPSVPANLAGKVSAVVGLDQSDQLIAPDTSNGNSPDQSHGAPSTGFRAGTPCADWYGSATVTTPDQPLYPDTAAAPRSAPLAPCGYTPAQVRGLYGLGPTATGDGQTVAFVGANASPTLQQDVTQYSDRHGLPAPSIQEIVAPGVYKHPDTPKQDPGEFYGEETLDAESIHTTAPMAKLLFVGSSNANQDFDASVNHIVDKHLASIISISYGFGGEDVPQGFVNSLNATFEQAVAEGIGVFVSSGDSGDESVNGLSPQPDFYADSPYVTAVGGTSAAVVPVPTATPPNVDQTYPAQVAPAYGGGGTDATTAAANWTRRFEVGWQTGLDPFAKTATITPTANGSDAYTLNGTLAAPLPGAYQSGGGGGISHVFGVPWYQQGVKGIQSGGRNVPDISALADPNTGFLVGQTQTFTDGTGTRYDEYRLGGTSLAAPLMAGIAADANQANGGAALGFLNPRIYGAYAQGAGSADGSATPLYDVDQYDEFCGSDGCSTADPLPALVRVNYGDNQSAASGRTFSVRTEEDDSTTLKSVLGYDTATGVGTPNAVPFFTALKQASR